MLELDVKISDLEAATKKYNLEKDKDIVTLKKQLQKEISGQGAAGLKVPPEMKQDLDKLKARFPDLDMTPTAEGTLTEETFWKIFEMVMAVQLRTVHRIVHSMGPERRKLQKENKKQEYAQKIQ